MTDIAETRLVNRTVLQLLDDLRGIPQTFDVIDGYVETRLRKRTANLTADAVKYLEAAGLIEACRATAADERCWKVTAKGMRQAQKMVPEDELDPMIWG